MSCPVIGSYSRTLVTASDAPKGYSLDTRSVSRGDIVMSRGLSSGSLTRRAACWLLPRSNTTIESSPWQHGPMPDAR